MTLSFCLNGRKLEKNLGDRSDLQLIFSDPVVISNASISCIEIEITILTPESIMTTLMCGNYHSRIQNKCLTWFWVKFWHGAAQNRKKC